MYVPSAPRAAGRRPTPDEVRGPLRLVALDRDPVCDLSPREREVLALMAAGRSNRAICETLWISPKTLERHIQRIFAKLDLPTDSGDHRRVRAVLAWLDSPHGGARERLSN